VRRDVTRAIGHAQDPIGVAIVASAVQHVEPITGDAGPGVQQEALHVSLGAIVAEIVIEG